VRAQQRKPGGEGAGDPTIRSVSARDSPTERRGFCMEGCMSAVEITEE
jgi:hypothetical protein